MRLDRAATKLLALVSTVGVVSALTVTSAASAGAATATGPRSQAIVALAGNGAVLAVSTPAPPAAGQQVTASQPEDSEMRHVLDSALLELRRGPVR